jgi:YesN/AraC family two-component response regulator
MYRVMIVDDEPWAIKGIRKAFNWKAFGFEVIAEATSSERAFELICEKRPDVVFTDIRMPKYNGIDLIRMTRERQIDTEFVVVSGYAEFAFAQEALRYGALDYVLKPVVLAATESLLKKMRDTISRKHNSRDRLILEALIGNDEGELRFLDPFFQSSAEPFWYALIVHRRDESGAAVKPELPGAQKSIAIKMGPGKILYLINTEKDPWAGKAPETLLEPGWISGGFSMKAESLKNAARIIKEADIAASKPFIGIEKAGVFAYDENVQDMKPLICDLQREYEQGNFDGIQDLLRRIKETFKNNKLGMAEAVFLWNQAISIVNKSQDGENRDIGLEYLNYQELKDRFKDFESLCSFIFSIFEQVKSQNGLAVEDKETMSYFRQMLEYINDHYSQELYLKELAARFFMSPFYCCHLFNKILGTTYSKYVTDVRIERACQLLLRNPELAVEEIASRVGYPDYYYFNKVFKKQRGITPAKYRKNQIPGGMSREAE